jgi:hypothetical protein
MSSHLIQFGKYRFVCGLFWQSLSRPRELSKEAAELAKKVGCDLVVLRQAYSTAQAGFLQSGTQASRASQYSLAAAVASKLARDGAHYDGENQPVHNWLAAFRLPDGQWAYFAVRDGNFLPNGDFLGSQEEVFERLHGDYGLGGWNMVIGDAELEHYGFHNFSEKKIEALLGLSEQGRLKVEAGWRLRPVHARLSPRALMLVAGGGVVVALALAFGWTQYQAHLARVRAAEEAELLRQAELRRAMLAAPQPWVKAPTPLGVAQACMAHLTHLTPGGWALSDYGCGPGQARYAWTREYSTVALLLAQVPGAVIDAGGDTASYAQPLSLPARPDEALLTAQALLPALQSRMQLMGLGLKLAIAPAPPPPPPAPDSTQGTVAPAWNTYTYTVSPGTMSPLEVASMLSAPGVQLDKLRYRAGSWILEGVIYAK